MPTYDDDFGLEDEFGDDEFGASERRIARLLKRRAKLESLMPVVSPNRQRRVARRLAHIDKVLARSGYSEAQSMASAAMAASGVDGVAGLMFQTQAPPGLGRLVRLPFYPTTVPGELVITGGSASNGQQAVGNIAVTAVFGLADPNAVTIQGTDLGAVLAARTSGSNDFDGTGTIGSVAASIRDAINDPANSFDGVVTAYIDSAVPATVLLRASEATFSGVAGNAITLVGTAGELTISGSGTLANGSATVASTTNPMMLFEGPMDPTTGVTVPFTITTPQVSWATLRIVGFETKQVYGEVDNLEDNMIVVSDLQIGGGANLFTHEDFADAMIYDADQPEFCGLRDYPLLKSPNVASVQVQYLQGRVPQNPGAGIGFSCALLCEVLLDDSYGAHVSGPYARAGALVRQGGNFVR